MTVPDAVGLNVTVQLDVVALTPANVHGDPVNDPVAVPVCVNATVPAGADAVPAAEVSLTNAVQLVAWDTTIADSEQVTVVVVVLLLTVTELLVPELPL